MIAKIHENIHTVMLLKGMISHQTTTMLTPEKKNIRREYMNIIPLFQDKKPRVGNWRQNQNHESFRV